MNIGQRIKILRTELGMSQTELAQKMGYTSRTTISKIESGDIKVTTEDAVRFADALNSNIRLLMGWEESNNTLTNLPGQMSLLDMTNAEEITMNESMLLSTYRSLSDTTKENAFRILTIYDKADAVQKDLIDGLIDSFEEMQNLHQKSLLFHLYNHLSLYLQKPYTYAQLSLPHL